MTKNTFYKYFLILFYLISSISYANAQIEKPVKWNYYAKLIGIKSYELHIAAQVDENWHVYSQNGDEIIDLTKFVFASNPVVIFDGEVKEVGKLETKYDPNLKATLNFYSKQVDFVQKIKTKTKSNTLVKGTVTYVVCNDRKCLPPSEISFSIKVPASTQ